MEGTPTYLQAGFLLISVPNLVVILLLLLVFFASISVRLNRDDTSTIVESDGGPAKIAPSREPNG